MKKIFFLVLFLFSAAAILLSWTAKPILAAGIPGTVKSSTNSAKVNEEYQITVKANAVGQDGKIVHWLWLQEANEENHITDRYYDCVHPEFKFDDPQQPDTVPAGYTKIECENAWKISHESSSVYTYMAWAYLSTPGQGFSVSGLVTIEDYDEASKATVAVTAADESPPASGKDICKKSFSNGVEMKTANDWCDGSGQKWTFCLDNDSYYFECGGAIWQNCVPESAKETKNDLAGCPNPAAPKPLSPINNFDFSPDSIFDWESVSGPKNGKISGYEWAIYSAMPGDFSPTIGNEITSGIASAGQTGMRLSSSILSGGEYYFWRVRALTEDGRKSPWSEAANFKTSGSNWHSLPPTAEPCFSDCPTEGIVPCGTPDCPCRIPHFFQLADNILDFLIFRLVPVLAVLMLIIGGVMLFFGGAKPSTLQTAKSIITSTIIGLVVISAAFLAVGTILQAIGLADWTQSIYSNWWKEGFFQILPPTPPPGCG